MHLNQILDLPAISASSSRSLRQFVNSYTENTQALNALQCEVSDNNPLLSAVLLRKLDTDLRKKLEAFRSVSAEENNLHTLPTADEIIKFLNTECAQSEDANLHSVGIKGSTNPHTSSFTKNDPRNKFR